MRKLWINGEFGDGASGATLPVFDPAAEELVDTVPKAWWYPWEQ